MYGPPLIHYVMRTFSFSKIKHRQCNAQVIPFTPKACPWFISFHNIPFNIHEYDILFFVSLHSLWFSIVKNIKCINIHHLIEKL